MAVRDILNKAREARRQHKAWGEAKRNPRIVYKKGKARESGRQMVHN
jgi:hypothetical protein